MKSYAAWGRQGSFAVRRIVWFGSPVRTVFANSGGGGVGNERRSN